MATFIWTLQGGTPTVIDVADKLQFAGASFDTAITVGNWQDTIHVEGAGTVDDSSGNTPENNKFISQTGGTASDSEADWGDGTEDIDAILESECSLKINFAHGSSVAITNNIFYAYDGATTTVVPTDVDFKAAEFTDIVFTDAEGSAAAVTVTDSASSTSHDFFFLVTASPSAVGEKTAFVGRMELTYT